MLSALNKIAKQLVCSRFISFGIQNSRCRIIFIRRANKS